MTRRGFLRSLIGAAIVVGIPAPIINFCAPKTYSEIVAEVFRVRSADIERVVCSHNALLKRLEQQGVQKPWIGGYDV